MKKGRSKSFVAFSIRFSVLSMIIVILLCVIIEAISEYNVTVMRYRWFILIPTVIVIAFIELMLYKWQMRKMVAPLNEVIKNYNNTKKVDLEGYYIATEFKPIIDNYIKLLEQNRKSEEDKNLIIASISHDLKTPLTAIKGYEQAFKDNIVPPEKRDEYIDAIINRTDNANDLLESLFDFTKLGYSEYNLMMDEVDINSFTREYLSKKRTDIEEEEFILETEIPDEEYICKLDKKAFTRVYDNLLHNSLKYNKEGTKVLFKIIQNDDNIKIIVADNGKGVPSDIKDKIFELFVTENEARELGKGTGLGLSIVKLIVKGHNGAIELNKNPIEGYVTEFDIEMPKEP